MEATGSCDGLLLLGSELQKIIIISYGSGSLGGRPCASSSGSKSMNKVAND